MKKRRGPTHKCKECGETFRYHLSLARHQEETGHQGCEIEEAPLVAEDHSLKNIAEKLEWKMMQPRGDSDLRVSSDFTAELEDFSQSLFHSDKLGKSLAYELQSGFGHALGRNMLDWLWDHVQPSFESGKQLERRKLRLAVPPAEQDNYSSLLENFARTFALETGVQLPAMVVVEGDKRSLSWRGRQLGVIESAEVEEATAEIGRLLKDSAWLFLTLGQVEKLLKALWGRRPELYRAYKEAKVEISMTTKVLRDILQSGHSIRELESLIESLITNRLRYNRADVADAVISDMRKLLGWGRRSAPTASRKTKAPGRRPRLDYLEHGVADDICFEVGRGLLDMVDPQQGETMTERLETIRRTFLQEAGWILPGVRVRDNLSLEANEFRVLIRDVECLKGRVFHGLLFAVGPWNRVSKLRGVDGVDPVHGMPGRWVSEEAREACEELGCILLTAETLAGSALAEAVWANVHKVFSLQTFRAHLTSLKESFPETVDYFEESPKLFKQGKSVFCRLLEERVSLRDPVTILDSLVEHEDRNLSPFFVTELVRETLKGLVCQPYLRSDGELYGLTLSKEVESFFRQAVQTDEHRAWIEPEKDCPTKAELRRAVNAAVEELREQGQAEILVVPADLRRPIWDFFRLDIPRLTVLSERELPTSTALVSLGDICLQRTRPKKAWSRPFPRGRRSGTSYLNPRTPGVR